jgi:hypothetical protein
MQYALLIYNAPAASAAASGDIAPDAPTTDEWIAYTRSLKSADALRAAVRLQSVETATSVRVREGERLLTDGPFIETKEHLLGFYLVEAPSLDAALEWAARMPISRSGTVEVRPVMPTPALTRIVEE